MKLKNESSVKKNLYLVTRELVEIDPGEEIEFDGDIELIEDNEGF